MKQKQLFMVVFLIGLGGAIGGAHIYQYKQSLAVNALKNQKSSLSQKVHSLKTDIRFMKEHATNIQSLNEKGYLSSHHRLKIGEYLEKLASPLMFFTYTFEPESIQQYGPSHIYPSTKIIFQVNARLDKEVFIFIENLLATFPGVLIPKELMFSRETIKGGGTSSGFRDCITATLIFDWVKLQEAKNET